MFEVKGFIMKSLIVVISYLCSVIQIEINQFSGELKWRDMSCTRRNAAVVERVVN